MNKRILAFICMLALLVGLLPVGAIAQTEESTYMVGYAKKDINPWKDLDNKFDEDGNPVLLPVLLTGNGNDSERACTGLMDDNGDGVTDENDGLFTTCTAVTDTNGITVLFISLDTLQGDPTLIAGIRNEIIKNLGANVVNGNQIMISGSHTHSGPYILNAQKHNVIYEYVDGVAQTKSYYNYIRDQAVAAAVEAFNNQASATLKRGSIDAKEATAAMGKNNSEGYQMNFLRHFKTTATNIETSKEEYYVHGASFNTISGTYPLDENTYNIGETTHVAEADDTMHLLQFEFEDTNKKPIVLVNWRAHPTTNSGDYPTVASSDYVNALRYQLENSESGYRVAFFQGAGANTVISSVIEDANDWKSKEATTIAEKGVTNTYGALLADVAKQCLNNMAESYSLPYGDIRIVQKTFTSEIQSVTDEMYAAAKAAKSAYNAANTTVAKNAVFPYEYKVANAEVYTVNSILHADQLVKRYEMENDETDAVAKVKDFTTQEIAAVSLGNSAVFVTAPNELSDRYGVSSYADTENELWASLVNEATYGTPFVLTHTNGSMGYLPNTLNFDYNKDIQDIARIGIGSYEANTCHYARGTGEALIKTYAEMLTELDSEEETSPCEDCKADVVWKPVSYLQYKDNYLGSGHYYLTDDIPSNVYKTVRSEETLCLDLNGHSIMTNGRSFSVEKDGELNIFDSVGTGSVTSTESGANYVNGTLNIAGEMNIYGGTFAFNHNASAEKPIARGGVATVSGTLNMYGGKIVGTTLTKLNDETKITSDDGVGAAIYVSGGTVKLYNKAQVTSGSVPTGGFGPCIALSRNANSKVYLYDEASVEDIYFRNVKDKDTLYPNLVVSGTYEGTVGLSYESGVALTKDMIIGTVENSANISGATFNLPKSHNGQDLTDWFVYDDGSNLKIKEGYDESTVAVIGGNEYTSLQNAIAESTEKSVIKLIKDETAATTVDKNVYLDLNGYDVNGTVTVNTNVTLYCMDSQTDDYTVADEKGELTGYGKLKEVDGEGEVKGIPEDSELTECGYLKVTENDGVSFHSVDLRLQYITLSPGAAPGVSYKGTFKGDEKVAAAVESYGVALSVLNMPSEQNLKTECGYSEFYGFNSGDGGNTQKSTKLTNIMKPANATLINYRNANMKIYGRAYIKTADNEYMFGEGQTHTLKTVTEKMDQMWNALNLDNPDNSAKKDALIQMYDAHESVMKHWALPNLKNASGLD